VSCFYADIPDWQENGVTLNCNLAPEATCDAKVSFVANLNVMKPQPQTNQVTAVSTVMCANKTACNDGIDNDGDGKIDLNDPDCTDPSDNSEHGVTVYSPQCRDGVDNDGDGKIDALVQSAGNGAAQATIAAGDPQSYIPGFNARAAQSGVGPIQDAALFDQATAQKICQVMGYTTAVSVDSRHNDGRNGFTSPGNNTLSRWNPATNSFDYLNAKAAGNRWIATLVCGGTPADCSNGKDDDGDGATDFPADNGCASATDSSERPHDPGCSNPDDNDERDSLNQCEDGIDNDGDGKTDFPADAGCSSPNDTDETGEPDCADGKDNDGDGWIDFPDDGGCSSKEDTSERDPYGPQCDNGIDDDSDGKIDFPNDSDCTGPKDPTEATQCSDKKDNDSDGLIDMQDPGCANPQDDNESDEPQCADRKDNDGDGKIDLQDLGCKDASDNNESDEPKLQCADGKDNDNDGKIDFPADPGCANVSDDNEGDEPKFQCSDKIDNDGDGWIDFPEDTGCTSAEDNDESNPINPITPTVSCLFDNGDGSSTAFFGYENSSSQVVEIAAGTSDRVNINAFSPGAANQGQPSSFKPGKSVAAFSVLVWNAEPVTWTTMVNGSAKNSVTAKKGVSKDCAPLIPILECVDQKSSSQFTARFGYDNQNGFEVPLPIGQFNKFSPGAQDRGQPNKFFSGVVKTAFMVDFSRQELTWQLAAQSATASEHSKPCNPNTAPVCNAGGPYAKACQGTETKITLDGSASQDPEGKTLTYKWSSSCSNIKIDNATSAAPIVTLTGPGLGEPAQCSVSLTVNDGVKSSSCEAPVEVPACSNDCNNKPGGSAQVDICGVCGGDGTSCLGCDGVPNSGAALDKCGVCGGNNSCVGCDGVPNSGKVNDACGVCGGDGQTCVQCTESDIMQTLFAMDSNAKKQEANALQILRRLSRQAKDQKTKQLAEQGKIEASKLNSVNWQLTWSLPQVIKTCPESSACSTSDNSITISSYNTNAASFRDLSQQALRELARVLGGSLRPDDKKLGVSADRLYNEAVATADTVPRFQSVCQ
jgi:hypothetical protein